MIIPREEFTCEACDHDYDTYDDAYECCGSTNITSRKWKVCSICSQTVHDSYPTCCTVEKIEAKLLRLKANILENQSGAKLQGLAVMQEYMADCFFKQLELVKKENHNGSN